MMKKSLLSKLAAVLALSVAFTGCGESGGSRTAERNIGNDERRRYPKSGG